MTRTANQVKHDKKHNAPGELSHPNTSKIQVTGRRVAMTHTTNQVKHDKKHNAPGELSRSDTKKLQATDGMVAMTRTANQVKHNKKHNAPGELSRPHTMKTQVTGRRVAITCTANQVRHDKKKQCARETVASRHKQDTSYKREGRNDPHRKPNKARKEIITKGAVVTLSYLQSNGGVVPE